MWKIVYKIIINFGKKIGAFGNILKLIKTGYHIPIAVTHRGFIWKIISQLNRDFILFQKVLKTWSNRPQTNTKRTQRTTYLFFNILRKIVKFDLKSGLHHINICKECQTILWFQWKRECYWLTVLPFGLSKAPYVLTKCFRALVKYGRSNNIEIVLYLDDGQALAESFEKC